MQEVTNAHAGLYEEIVGKHSKQKLYFIVDIRCIEMERKK